MHSILAILTLSIPHAFSASPQGNLRLIQTSPEMAALFLKAQGPSIASIAKDVLLVPRNKISLFAEFAHRTTGHCGGFIDLTDEKTDPNTLPPLNAYSLPNLAGPKPEIAEGVAAIQAVNIEKFDRAYTSNFKTRHADTPEGEQAPVWLAHAWKAMADAAERSDIQVDLLPPPRNYQQNNVRITIPGANPELPVVVLGAHLDSINAAWDGGDEAPGADDDASGIATITEVYRVLLAQHMKPRATIQIFGYAAEELGLYGSRAIAEHYRSKDVKVRGVMQLDMTAFVTETNKVTFMQDFVNKDLTLWSEQVYGTYVGGEFKEDRCGYGCSDHASWDRFGYPAVMPFESTMRDMNHRIHTAADLWDHELNAEYAARFAKLAYAFALELANH